MGGIPSLRFRRGKLSQQMTTVMANNCLWNSRDNCCDYWKTGLDGEFSTLIFWRTWSQNLTPTTSRQRLFFLKSATHRFERSTRLQFSAQTQSPLQVTTSVRFLVNLILCVLRYKPVSGGLDTTTYWRFNPIWTRLGQEPRTLLSLWIWGFRL